MMILNAFTISEIFIGLISFILMTWAGSLALILAIRWSGASTMEERSEIEKRSHLVLLVTVIVLGIRIFNWPLFYATLQSFVSDIDGAMCIFGVTQVKRILTGVSELIRPVSFFLMGGWLLINSLDQRTRTSPLMGIKLYFLSITAVVVIAESLLDVVLMFQIGPGTLISCCTTVTDILERPTRLIPESVLGGEYKSILWYSYYTGNILLMVLCGICLRHIKSSPTLRWRMPVLGVLFLYAIGNAAVFVLTQVEVHAPRIMGLPFHHCLYCLWQYVPDTILMYILFVLGTSAIGWAFLLDLVGRTDETRDTLPRFLQMLYGFAIFCLAASMLMNTIHLIAA
jgi:hypothetical protein